MKHVPNNPAAERFAFDNTYARELEGFYVPWKAAQVARPRLVTFNRELAEELGLDAGALDSEEGARIFAGNETPEGAVPLAASCPNLATGGRCSWAR
jgi:uncharacterized protein YdiU (UPF0061 family)